jgi:hypothetical protein
MPINQTAVTNDVAAAEQLIQIAIQFYVRAQQNAGLSDADADTHYDTVSAQIKDQIAAERARIAAL